MINTRYLMTGATGYLGATALHAIVEGTDSQIVILIRRVTDQNLIIEDLRANLEADNNTLKAEDEKRLSFIQFTSVETLEAGLEKVKPLGVDAILHCAGCVDYYDREKLTVGNIDFTRKLVEFAKENSIDDFIYISTSLSSGYLHDEVPEILHGEPEEDPTVYTESKRQAEWVIADSGLDYRILRPTIVIGDSQTGRYTGKRYGLYQQWVGFANLLCDRYHETIHLVGPKQPLNFIHQDAFKNAFFHALVHLKPKSIMHITSNLDSAPTMRDVWMMWLQRVTCPKQVIFYDKFEHIPLKNIPTRQRAYLTFAAINLEIASHPWRFETTHLDKFRAQGLDFSDASLKTIKHCQERFACESEKIIRYKEQFRDDLSNNITSIDARNLSQDFVNN